MRDAYAFRLGQTGAGATEKETPMDAKLAFENDCKWGETMLRERGEVRPMFVVHCNSV